MLIKEGTVIELGSHRIACGDSCLTSISRAISRDSCAFSTTSTRHSSASGPPWPNCWYTLQAALEIGQRVECFSRNTGENFCHKQGQKALYGASAKDKSGEQRPETFTRNTHKNVGGTERPYCHSRDSRENIRSPHGQKT